VNPVGLIAVCNANGVVYGAVVPRRILELVASPVALVLVMGLLMAQGLVVAATVQGSLQLYALPGQTLLVAPRVFLKAVDSYGLLLRTMKRSMPVYN